MSKETKTMWNLRRKRNEWGLPPKNNKFNYFVWEKRYDGRMERMLELKSEEAHQESRQ